MAHFNRERIPERVVHAKGSGAYGTLHRHQGHHALHARQAVLRGRQEDRAACCASRPSPASAARPTPSATCAASRIKFYTEEGNWDLVGNNTPVFFVRDPLKFSDFIHTQKRDPKTNLRSPTAMWDFWSLSPESLHQVTILFSDRGLPKNYRQMHGFGSHTYSFINADERALLGQVPLQVDAGHREPDQRRGRRRWSATTARAHQRDLFEAIERGDFPKWRVCVQVMPEKEAETYRLNPFDLTKVWPHKDYPLIEVGILELNRNPENYFAEVEQAAFAPSNIVPGIGHSPDKMLQARDLLLRRRAPLPARRQSTTACRSTSRAARSTPITATAPCASTATAAAPSTTSPTASAGRSNRPPTASRRCASPATPTATITAPATTTTASRATLFRLMSPAQRDAADGQHRRAR